MKKNKKAALTLAVLSALSNVFIGTSEAEETLMNPAGGAPILVEHPTSATITNGTGTTIGSGAANNGTTEAVVVGQDATIQKYNGTENSSFDTVIGHKASVTGTSSTAIGSAANVNNFFGGTAIGTAASVYGTEQE